MSLLIRSDRLIPPAVTVSLWRGKHNPESVIPSILLADDTALLSSLLALHKWLGESGSEQGAFEQVLTVFCPSTTSLSS
jgi:hypothetical protein